jgi:hypothetical protein
LRIEGQKKFFWRGEQGKGGGVWRSKEPLLRVEGGGVGSKEPLLRGIGHGFKIASFEGTGFWGYGILGGGGAKQLLLRVALVYPDHQEVIFLVPRDGGPPHPH